MRCSQLFPIAKAVFARVNRAGLLGKKEGIFMSVLSNPSLGLRSQFVANSPHFFRHGFSPKALRFFDRSDLSRTVSWTQFSFAPQFAKKILLNTISKRSFGVACATGLTSLATFVTHQLPGLSNWNGFFDAVVKGVVPAAIFAGLAKLHNHPSITLADQEHKPRLDPIVGSVFVSSILGAWLNATEKYSDPFDLSFVVAGAFFGAAMMVEPIKQYFGVKKAIGEFDQNFLSGPNAEANVERVFNENPDLRKIYDGYVREQ